MNQYDIIRRWVDHCTGQTGRFPFARGHHNVFADGDTLYSYGYHFEMAVHLDWGFLVNADRSSVSTNRQRLRLMDVLDGHGDGWNKRDLHPKHTRLVIPFEALIAAGVLIKTVVAMDSLPDRYVTVRRSEPSLPKYVREGGEYRKWWISEHNARQTEDGWEWTEAQHRLGECVFRATVEHFDHERGYFQREAWFISAWDNQDTNTYFLSELPHEVFSLPEAYEALKPQTVKIAEIDGRRIIRQGDIFAVETEYTTRDLTRMGAVRSRMEYVLGTNHVVTEQAVLPNGAVLGRGVLHHKPPFRDADHRRQRIGKTWAVLVRNTTPISTKEV